MHRLNLQNVIIVISLGNVLMSFHNKDKLMSKAKLNRMMNMK